MRAAQEVKKNLPDTLLTNPIMNRFFESFLSIEVHVLIRFGRWSEILSREVPTDHQVRCIWLGSLQITGISLTSDRIGNLLQQHYSLDN